MSAADALIVPLALGLLGGITIAASGRRPAREHLLGPLPGMPGVSEGINAAIAQMAIAGGGQVTLRGRSIAEEPLLLRSGVELIIPFGASLEARPDFQGEALIQNATPSGDGALRISGGGIIDVNRQPAHGVYIQSSSIVIRDVEIQNAGGGNNSYDGVYVTQGSGGMGSLDMLGATVHDAGRHCVHLTNADGNKVIGCTLYSAGAHDHGTGAGLFCSLTADGEYGELNIFSCPYGLYTTSSSWVTLSGGQIHTCWLDLVSLNNGNNNQVNGVALLGPSFGAPGRYSCVALNNEQYDTVQGCSMQTKDNAALAGIVEMGGSDYNALGPNTFDDRAYPFSAGRIRRSGANSVALGPQ